MTNKTKRALELVDEIENHVNDTSCLRREKLNECTQKLRSILQEANEEKVAINNNLILLPNGDGYCTCCGDINDGKIQTDTCFGCEAPITWLEQQEEAKENYPMTNKTKRAFELVDRMKEACKLATIYHKSITPDSMLGDLEDLMALLSEQEGMEVDKPCWPDNKVLTEEQKNELLLTMNEDKFKELYCHNIEPDEQGEGKEEAFEVVEYIVRDGICLTSCKHKNHIMVGSKKCRDECKSYICDESPRSIRCSAKKVGG